MNTWEREAEARKFKKTKMRMKKRIEKKSYDQI